MWSSEQTTQGDVCYQIIKKYEICHEKLFSGFTNLLRGWLQLAGEHSQDADQQLSLFAVEVILTPA